MLYTGEPAARATLRLETPSFPSRLVSPLQGRTDLPLPCTPPFLIFVTEHVVHVVPVAPSRSISRSRGPADRTYLSS